MQASKLELSSIRDKVANALKNDTKTKQNNKSKSKGSKKPREKTKKQTKEPTKKHVHTKQDDLLRKEALELGATEDDLKLVEDVNDDEEEIKFDAAKTDKKLQKDVSSFIKSLDLAAGTQLEAIEDEEEEQEEEDLAVAKENESEPEENIKEQIDEEIEAGEESSTQPSESKKDKHVKFDAPETRHHEIETNLQTVKSTKLLIPTRNDWYNILPESNEVADRSLTQSDIDELHAKAEEIVAADSTLYDEELNKSSSQKQFLTELLTNGTLSDKVSAQTLLVQEAPFHNTEALESLLGMCHKKSRTAASQCISAVTDLLINGILPPNRKLKYFKRQPLTKDLTDEQLALFWFEDYLKNWYFQFIGVLEVLSHDSMEFARIAAVKHIFELLKAKPEQEANLLRLGVNKLGDMERTVASKTSYEILLLEEQHPAMNEIILDAVVDVMFRDKNEQQHALYYSIITLNQTVLSGSKPDVANKLVNAYFAVFEKILVKTDSMNTGKLKESEHTKEGRHKRAGKKGKHGGKSIKKEEKSEEEALEERNSKLFSAILTGLNRAFPFSTLPTKKFEEQLNTLYKITHSSNFNTSVQALLLVHKIVTKQKLDTDRYYRTLYESLLDDRLLTSSKQSLYLNLLFKSIKEDTNRARTMAFVKRISQVCLSWLNIGTVSGMLYLLLQLEKSVPEINNVFSAPAEDEVYDPRKRDPKFAGYTSLWEIEFFMRHYHPTVQLYADKFESGGKIEKPDLGLFTLGHFLDRFVYKKPRANKGTRGMAIMQPLGSTGDMLVQMRESEPPANTQNWFQQKLEDVNPEDRFFHQYFAKKQSEENKKQKKELTKYEEGDELDEDEVWKALVASNPEMQADDDDLMSLSDFDYSDSDSDIADIPQEIVELAESDDDDDDDEEIPEANGNGSDSSDDEVFEDSEELSDEEAAKRSFEDDDDSESDADNTHKKVKLSSMPTFASADDYADLLDS